MLYDDSLNSTKPKFHIFYRNSRRHISGESCRSKHMCNIDTTGIHTGRGESYVFAKSHWKSPSWEEAGWMFVFSGGTKAVRSELPMSTEKKPTNCKDVAGALVNKDLQNESTCFCSWTSSVESGKIPKWQGKDISFLWILSPVSKGNLARFHKQWSTEGAELSNRTGLKSVWKTDLCLAVCVVPSDLTLCKI